MEIKLFGIKGITIYSITLPFPSSPPYTIKVIHKYKVTIYLSLSMSTHIIRFIQFIINYATYLLCLYRRYACIRIKSSIQVIQVSQCNVTMSQCHNCNVLTMNESITWIIIHLPGKICCTDYNRLQQIYSLTPTQVASKPGTSYMTITHLDG